MTDDNVAASYKTVNGIEVILAGQAIDIADDISPPLLRSRRKSSWAKRVVAELDDDVVDADCSTPIGNRKLLRL